MLRTILLTGMPTLGTGLARVSRVNRNQFPTAPVLFVFQHTAKHPPALSKLYQHCRGRGSPGGLQDAWTQDAIRVGG